MYEDIINNGERIAKLGLLFKRYRKALRMTQKDVQEKSGVSQFTISEFETGKNPGITLLNLCRLLDEIGCSENVLGLIPEVADIDLEKEWKTQNR